MSRPLPFEPLHDDENPFFCPGLSGEEYLRTIALKPSSIFLRANWKVDGSPIIPFRQRLRSGLQTDDSSDDAFPLNQRHPYHQIPPTYLVHDDPPTYHDSLSQDPQHAYTHLRSINPARSFSPGESNATHAPRKLKRKLDLVVSDSSKSSSLAPPPKRSRSTLSHDSRSFVLSTQGEAIRWSAPTSPESVDAHPLTFAELTGLQKPSRPVPSADIDSLLIKLHTMIPTLKHRIPLEQPKTSYQNVIDTLAELGCITLKVLKLFSDTDVERLDLRISMAHEDGMNIEAKNALKALDSSTDFRYLRNLNFSGVALDDFDVCLFHRLPSLGTLRLSDTGISNEGVFLLIRLKNTLTRLYIAENPEVNDDSIPTLSALRKLVALDVEGTDVTTDGIRTLVSIIQHEERIIHIDLPDACAKYFRDLDPYFSGLSAPFIVEPNACDSLSLKALKHNLAEHARHDSSIVTSGTRSEMAERLRKLLELRKKDISVLDMLKHDQTQEYLGEETETAVD